MLELAHPWALLLLPLPLLVWWFAPPQRERVSAVSARYTHAVSTVGAVTSSVEKFQVVLSAMPAKLLPLRLSKPLASIST